jgi:DNA-binding LytR/AlgR family response regulator
MMRVAALDDEPHALEIIKRFCADTKQVESVELFTKPAEAIQHMANHRVDLLFLDINMPAVSGLDFRKKIGAETLVVLASAHSEYAAEGFNLNVLDYLLKPFSFERFAESVSRAGVRRSLVRPDAPAEDHISLRVNYALIKIPLKKILYIEGLNDYIRVHMIGQKAIMSRTTLKILEDKLPEKIFIRVHRSYIVALNKISHINNKLVHIGGQAIPIGLVYEEQFHARIRSQCNLATNGL